MEMSVGLITAIVVLTTAIVAFFEKLRRDVKEIHVLVNNRMTEALARIEQLDAFLRQEGLVSPAKPGERVESE